MSEYAHLFSFFVAFWVLKCVVKRRVPSLGYTADVFPLCASRARRVNL